MKKIFFAALFVFFLGSCSHSNFTITEEEGGTKIVLGEFERELFVNEPNFFWFKQHYDEYAPDSAVIVNLKEQLSGLHYVIVIGTWCGDSKRETPHMVKVLDLAGIKKNKIEFYGVDRMKKCPDGATDQYNITRVPTLIVFDGGNELGRIVETPRKTTELDLIDIAKKKK